MRKKKPGPRSWAAKPIMKNDMKAKLEVIHEIERLWGKGFIKAYIPKCHRPLVKRGKTGKRSSYRDHETDPKKWLPSILKAILEIAQLTDDKKWLERAMNDVVRHRIKHTGNHKPQLVTTDFDVIADMLDPEKKWSAAYSFDIRYKHLLLGRAQQENGENIDHILQTGSDRVVSGQEDNGVEGYDDASSDDQDQDQGYGAISGKYQESSG